MANSHQSSLCITDVSCPHGLMAKSQSRPVQLSSAPIGHWLTLRADQSSMKLTVVICLHEIMAQSQSRPVQLKYQKCHLPPWAMAKSQSRPVQLTSAPIGRCLTLRPDQSSMKLTDVICPHELMANTQSRPDQQQHHRFLLTYMSALLNGQILS